MRFRDRPRHVWLVFIRRDPLTRVVAPLPVPARPDFTALPLGVREDLAVYCLRLLATHVLIGGATRMGKGSVIWSLLRSLAADIRSGLVRVWAIDPKGGMELSIGRPLFARYVDDDWTRMADLLDDAVTRMRARQQALRGKVRVHTPTTDEPLIVVVIDEIAALLAFLPDSDIRQRITQALGLLLTQGAGLGCWSSPRPRTRARKSSPSGTSSPPASLSASPNGLTSTFSLATVPAIGEHSPTRSRPRARVSPTSCSMGSRNRRGCGSPTCPMT